MPRLACARGMKSTGHVDRAERSARRCLRMMTKVIFSGGKQHAAMARAGLAGDASEEVPDRFEKERLVMGA